MNSETKFPSSIDELAKKLIGSQTSLEYVTDAFSDVGIQTLRVMPSVFRPEISFSGAFVARSLPLLVDTFKNKSVLDMGCGTGILGLICAVHGAKSVTFTDLNPSAVHNASVNAKALGIESFDAAVGSLFEPVVNRQFDVIIFNPPGIPGNPENLVEATVMSDNTLIADFFEQLPNYLTDGGMAIMPTSTKHPESRSPKMHAQRCGYLVEELATRSHEDGVTQYLIGVRPVTGIRTSI